MTDIAPKCCGVAARLTNGAEIYSHRPDLHSKNFYKCDRCRNYCGCHPGTDKPLGTPANAETRSARSRFHDRIFDPIWKNAVRTGGYTDVSDREAKTITKAARSRLYDFLAYKLQMERKDCHTGMFTLEQVLQAVEALRGVTYAEVREWHKKVKAEKARKAA